MSIPKVSIGTYLHGALRTEDLIDAALCCLITLDRERALEYREEFERMDEINLNEHGDDLYVEICDEIDTLLPPYLYWGSTEGDGSDIGVWVSHESIEQDIQDKELLSGEDFPDPIPGVGTLFLHVSDHGNMELYSATSGGWYSIWAIV